MKILQALRQLGLTDKEPEIYLTLLKTHGAQPASIIATRAGLNRTTVYKTLMKLAKKGLITKTQRHGIICFFAENPDSHLENLLSKQEKKLELLSQNLGAILPDIKNMQRHELLMPKMRFYEGLEGVKRIYEDTLKEGKTIYAFEDYGLMIEELREYVETYVPRRVAKGISAKVITPENPDCTTFRKKDKQSLRETKFLSKNLFCMEIEINIYGQKTAFFSTNDKEEMFAVILESQTIANSMKTIFDVCWQIAK